LATFSEKIKNKMKCPVCDELMVVLELEEIEIDYCTECEGIWLDGGELELLLEEASEKEELLSSFKVDDSSSETKIRCPICLKKMEKDLVGKENKILLDRCKNNHGLWFNKGELYDVVKLGSLDEENKILTLLKEIFKHKLSGGS
jgi:Zn-finger nucleic acid-binding protein